MAENTPKNNFKKPEKGKEPKELKESVKFTIKYNPRLKKVLGIFLIGFSAFLFFSFISFLFSWQADQSLVNNLSSIQLGQAKPEDSSNWMGLLGALASSFFIRGLFGLPSFIFVPLCFVLGYKILFENPHISFRRILTTGLFFTVFFSVLLGYIFNTSASLDYMGGTFGYESQNWIRGLVGAVGLLIFSAVAMMSYLIVMININFKLPVLFSKKQENLYPVDDDKKPKTTLKSANLPSSEDDIEEEDEDIEIDENEFQLIVKEPALKNAMAGVDEELKSQKDNFEKQTFGGANSGNNSGISFEVKPKALVTPSSFPPSEMLIANEKGDNDDINRGSWYKYPGINLLKNHENSNAAVDTKELEERKNLIVETLENYKIKIDKIEATIGPTVTLFEIIPAAGIRISKIKSLEDDIALSLAALGIRIIAPMPGKGTIGIEVPNLQPEIVSLKEALASPEFINSTADLPIALGRGISNEVFVADLAKMPHLLMAGATGQGKSVGINTIIASILYKKHPEDVKFVLVDPKKVELSLFKNIEKHFLPELPDGQEAIITDTKMVVDVLKSLCVEMDERYNRLKDAQVRNIKEYNKKIEKGQLSPVEHKRLPYIILVIDELADLMMTAGKEVEMPIARLAQLARAIGIHLIVATQRPSVNIITGIIKANFPARLAFRVTSRIDSRTILDTGGAEQLIGRGDMLFSTGNDIIRLQCPYVDTEEVDTLTKYISEQPYPETFRLNIITEDGESGGVEDFDGDLDSMFEDAARMVVRTQQGSTSMLQRRLKLGYNRAGRVMDQLEKAGIVGANEGSKAREVLISDEYALEQFLNDISSKLK